MRDVAELERLIAAGDRGEALALFMRYAGSLEAQIEEARASSYWAPGSHYRALNPFLRVSSP